MDFLRSSSRKTTLLTKVYGKLFNLDTIFQITNVLVFDSFIYLWCGKENMIMMMMVMMMMIRTNDIAW